jgi:hypothetical protein
MENLLRCCFPHFIGLAATKRDKIIKIAIISKFVTYGFEIRKMFVVEHT